MDDMNNMSDFTIYESYESPITMEVKKCCDKIIEERENSIMLLLQEELGFYIDKNELIKALNYDRDQYAKGYQEGHYDGHLEGYTKAINEERPKGEWHYYNNSNINGYIHNGCKCREEVFDYAYNFCPNCGADMRGIKNDT